MLLEVIALDAVDAAAARAGGADRLEVVSDIAADGLCPSRATLEAIRAACDLPLRVMLRLQAGFLPGDLDALLDAAVELDTAMGERDGFVLGFLNAGGEVDLAATLAVAGAVPGRPWTFHRAVDHAVSYERAWEAIAGLPGLDQVLTAGSAAGVGEGLGALAAHARPGLAMAGGGLRPEHVPALVDMGVRAFHIGGMARPGWDRPVEADLVRRWRGTVDAGALGVA